MQYLLGGDKRRGVVKGRVPFARVFLSNDERKRGLIRFRPVQAPESQTPVF